MFRLVRATRREGEGVLVFVQGALVFLYAFWTVFHWGGAGNRRLISDLAFLAIAAVPPFLAWRASNRPFPDARARRAWRLLALAFLGNWLGEALWAYYEILRGIDPFPSWADAAYLSTYPLMLWGLLTFPLAPRRGSERIKFWLDVGTVFLGAGMVQWHFVLRPTALARGTDPLSAALATAYPAGDLALLFGTVTVLFGRPPDVSRRSLHLLAGGMLFWLGADFLYGYRSLQGTFESGSWIDLGWLAAYFLIALAAHEPAARADGASPPPAADSPEVPPAGRFDLVPHAAIALGYGLLLWGAHREWSRPLGDLIIGATLLTSLALARQRVVLADNARLMTELLHCADHDPLTGIHNRRRFLEELERQLAHSRRHGTRGAVLLLDLDGFKAINDTLGHLAGDDVLREVAARLKGRLRETDLVARLGGDEFGVLLLQVGAPEARRVAEDLVASVESRPVRTGEHESRVGASVGIALFPEHGGGVAELLGKADTALYRAKDSGGGHAGVFADEPG